MANREIESKCIAVATRYGQAGQSRRSVAGARALNRGSMRFYQEVAIKVARIGGTALQAGVRIFLSQ